MLPEKLPTGFQTSLIPQDGVPCAPDIERAVIGALLFEPEHIPSVIASGGAYLFYNPVHQEVINAIIALHEEGIAPDQLTITERLRNFELLDQIGGEREIVSLAGEINSAANILHHIEILAERAARRKLAYLCSWTVQHVCNCALPLIRIVEEHGEVYRDVVEEVFRRRQSLADRIREWVLQQDGNFFVTDCYKDLDIATVSNKANCRMVFARLAEEGLIERHGDRRGSYRRIENDCRPEDWLDAPLEPIALRFPLGIEELVTIMPGNVMVIAGVSNAGKTAFLMNFARMNMDAHRVHYFSSEMGREEFNLRVREHADLPPAAWKRISFYERGENFSDVIRPNDINIIDFLELHEDFWKVGGLIHHIHSRLDRGVAFIALQKNPGADHGLGGARSIEKARLYLALEPGKCTIRKAKIFKQKNKNPNGLSMAFKIVDGARFLEEKGGWRREEK